MIPLRRMSQAQVLREMTKRPPSERIALAERLLTSVTDPEMCFELRGCAARVGEQAQQLMRRAFEEESA